MKRSSTTNLHRRSEGPVYAAAKEEPDKQSLSGSDESFELVKTS